MTGDFCHWDGADLVVEVRVIPRARRTGCAGVRHGRLVVRLQTPPVEGRANAALVQWLARAAGVSRSAVLIEKGEHSRDKRVRLVGPDRLPAALFE